MEIIDNKALQLVTRKHQQIKALIPRSAVLEVRGNKAKMLIRWNDDEAQILRNLGIKGVPHPILGKYEWAGVYAPFDHQRTTAAFLATHPRAFCFNDAGTGKSAACAWAADYLMRKGKVKRVLIVCPVSIMDTAWRADLFRTIMHRTVAIATGSRVQRERVISGNYEFVIINYDGVKVVRDALAKGAFDLIIADEANALKSVSTDRWKAFSSLIKPDTRLWMLTGTPASQSPLDAYGLARLVNPAAVPRYFNAFRDQVMVKVTQYKYVPRADAKDKVYTALQPAIRFTKDECLDLPDMLYATREVPLTKQQKHYYELIRKHMAATAAGEEITAVNAATLLGKLLQVSGGCVYSTDKEVIEFDMSARFNELLNVIDSTEHKIIVFVPYRHILTRLEDELTKHGITNASLHGGVPAGQRASIVKSFQTEDNPRMLLAHPAAMAHGLTLTRADTVVWWGPTPSTELYLQGNARAHRAGQKNKVTVVRLQGSPVEARMYRMLDDKVDVHQNIVELYKQEVE